MPHTTAALADGALSPEHVDVLAGANSGRRSVLFAAHEETLVEQAKLLRFGDCCQMVEYWKQRADAAGCDDEAQRRHEARHGHGGDHVRRDGRRAGPVRPARRGRSWSPS